MCGRISGLVVAVALAWTEIVTAQEVAAASRTRYVFPTTPEVVVKMEKSNNLKYVRGKLLSLTASEIVVDTGKSSARDRELGDVGQRIGFERIESIRTTDGRLEFRTEEDFQEVAQRISASYTSVTTEVDLAPPESSGASGPPNAVPEVPPVTETPPVRKPPLNGLGNGGFGGIKNLPKPKQTDSTTPATPPSVGIEAEKYTTPANPPAAATTSGASEDFLCSNCMKDIPASAIKSGVCPHCKIAFSNVAIPASNPASNPFGPLPGTPGSTAGAFAPTSNVPSVAPAANPGYRVTQGNGFSIDSIPNWAKAGLFVLLVLIGWHLVFNR